MCVFYMGSSFAHTRINGISSPDGLGWSKKTQDPYYKYCERMITVDERVITVGERVITVNKLWIHHYDPKFKCESETWLQKWEQKHQKVQQQKSVEKVQLVAFFISRGDDLSIHLSSLAENGQQILHNNPWAIVSAHLWKTLWAS